MQIVGDWRPHTRLVRRISVCNEMYSSTDTLQCTYISETRCHEMHFADHKYLELHLRQELRPVPRWWLPPAPYSFIERTKEGNGYWGKERKAIGGDEGNKEEETGGSPTHISPAHASAEKGVLIEKKRSPTAGDEKSPYTSPMKLSNICTFKVICLCTFVFVFVFVLQSN